MWELLFAATKYDLIRDPQVSTETEIKVKIDDVGDFSAWLNVLNPETLFARHLEDSLVLDFPDSSFRAQITACFASGLRRIDIS